MAAKLKAADIIENWPNRLEYTGLEKMLMAVSIALLAVTMVRLGLNYGSYRPRFRPTLILKARWTAVTARVPCSFWPVWMWRAPC